MSKYIKLDNIYYLFWCITHSIISLVFIINNYFNKIFKLNKFIPKDVNNLVKELNKIPKHIAICFNEDFLDCQQLSQLIQWCQQFGVTYVSLFSNNDLLFKHLDKHLNCPKSQKNGYKISDSVKHRTNGFNNNNQMNGNINPLISFENLKVCVVSYEDSKQSIVKVAKHLCRQNQPFDQNDISEELRKTYDFPDPELLMSFGGSSAVYSYPLWQLRLTEMYFLPTHRYFQFDDFSRILIKYSKCEQRFGK